MWIVADVEPHVKDGSACTVVLVGHQVAVIVDTFIEVSSTRLWKKIVF